MGWMDPTTGRTKKTFMSVMNDLNDRLSENLSQKVFFGRDVDLTAHETEDRLFAHDANFLGTLDT